MSQPRAAFSSGIRPASAAGRTSARQPVVGNPVEAVRETRCSYTDPKKGWCRGPRAKGTEYCIGHLRARGEA